MEGTDRMKKILVTGGTVFVSRTLAEYFVAKGDEVYVLNRNNKPQSKGVILIEADRYNLGESLKNYDFDVVIDANSYTGEEMTLLLDALPTVKDYVFISTSAVYPDVSKQPFTEKTEVGFNNYWTNYGTNKIEAEDILTSRIPDAFILRPAYIYGPYNNAYREAFVFDCAKNKRPFYLPKTGEMKLQFIHMHDICRLVDSLLTNQPKQKIYNVGNEEAPSIKEWVSMCYEIVGETPEFIEVMDDISPLKYFSFADYQYLLNVDHQMEMTKTTIDFKEGLKESWTWYQNNENLVNKRDYQLFIDENLA